MQTNLLSDVQAKLDMCARAIADGFTPSLSLHSLASEWSQLADQIPGYLAERVEEYSHDGRTIRPADAVLFDLEVMGPCLHLVVCSADTPAGTVTELTSDMALVILMPQEHGLMVNVSRTAQAIVNKLREAAARSTRQTQDQEQTAADVKKYMAHLVYDVSDMVRTVAHSDAERREALEMIHQTDTPSLEALARACRLVGTELSRVLS